MFEPILKTLAGERDRGHAQAAFAALEYSSDPVSEAQAPGLRAPDVRRAVADMLHAVGRDLIEVEPYRWTSGYRDDLAARLAESGDGRLPQADRAVLVLVLTYSVAMPRAEGKLGADMWTSPYVAPIEELRRRTQIAAGTLKESLERLRTAGLVRQANGPTWSGGNASGYLPGPQLHRLTRAARTRLQDELILAAAPASPLASAIRARRAQTQEQP